MITSPTHKPLVVATRQEPNGLPEKSRSSGKRCSPIFGLIGFQSGKSPLIFTFRLTN